MMHNRLGNRRAFQRLAGVGIATALTALGLIGTAGLAGTAGAATTSVPGAPTGVRATDTGGGQVTVSWSAPTSGGTPVGYNVYTGAASGLGLLGLGSPTFNTTPANGSVLITNTSTVVTGLSTSSTTYFEVEAVNEAGSSGPSSEASATAGDVAPSAPTGLTATNAGPTSVNLAWTPSTSNGAGGTTGITYNVYEGTTSGGESTTAVGGLTFSTNSAGKETTTVGGLTTGRTYYFVVTATSGGASSGASNEASATPDPTVPSAPVLSLTATSATSASLSWTASTAQGSAVEGYDVYVGTSPGGESSSPANGVFLVTGTTYTVTGLTTGVTYYFTVEAVSALGNSQASNEVHALPSTTTPSAPTGLTATAGYDSAQLSWTAPASPGASPVTSYQVLVGTTSGQEAAPASGLTVTYGTAGASGTPATTATVSGLTDGTAYYFTVEAVNGSGASGPSNEASATPEPGAPGAPTALTATASATAISLTWTAPADAGSSSALTYEVYNGSGVLQGSTSTTSDTITGLSTGTTYSYYVVASDSYGASPASNTVSIATGSTAPQPPTGLIAAPISGSSTSVHLTWTAPTNQGGSAVTSYVVLAGPSSGSEAAVPAGHVTYSGTSATVTGLSAGSTDYFEVEAVNSSSPSTSGPSNQAVAAPAAVPDAPTGLTGTAGYQSATLTWTAPAAGNGSGVTGYDVYEGTSAAAAQASTSPINTSPITTTSYTVTGLTDGTTYYFTVAAINSVGVSAPTAAVGVTPNPSAPSAPTGVVATTMGTLMDVSWSAPATLNGSTIEGYDLYVGTSSTSTPSTGPLNGTALLTATSAVVDGLSPGTTYYFAVKAVTANGSSPLSASSAASAQTGPESDPSAPSTPVATPGGSAGTITVTWSAPASDGGTPITGYILTPYLGGAAQSAIDLSSAATSYTVTGLGFNQTYTFTVTAVNAIGTGPASPMSNAATAPTVAAPTIAATNRAGRGNVVVAGVATPGTTVDLFYEPYGSTTFSQVQSKPAAANGGYGFSSYLTKSSYFYVETDGVKSAVVRSEVTDAVSQVLTGGVHEFRITISTNPAVDVLAYVRQNLATGALPRLKTVRLDGAGRATVTIPVRSTGTIRVSVRIAGGDGSYGGVSPVGRVTIRS